MSLEQVYQLAGVVAAIGVIGSLLYLGVQVHQNTRSVRMNTGQSVTENLCTFFRYAADCESADLIFKGFQNLDNLAGADRMRFFAIMHDFFFTFQNAYIQLQLGTLDAKHWEAAVAHFKHQATFPGMIAYWEHRSFLYTKPFKDFYDREILQAEADTPQFNLAGIQFERREGSAPPG